MCRWNISATASAMSFCAGERKLFENFRVVPPGTAFAIRSIWSIWQKQSGPAKNAKMAKWLQVAYPDTLVGTDSYTTMVNGLAVLGWGVGGIEAGRPQCWANPSPCCCRKSSASA